MKVNGIRIEGRSVSGYATTVALPEYDVAFDCGMAVHDTVQCQMVAITHGHMDHFGEVARHAYIRGMAGMSPSIFHIPASLKGRVEQVMKYWADVQEARMAPFCVKVVGEEPVKIGKDRFLRSFKTDHRIKSQGYVLVEQRKRLKPEYAGTPGRELGRMRREGIDFEEVFEVPLVAFTGDTRATLYDRVEFKAKVLIAECTFLEDVSVDEARKKGHTHISELAAKADRFEGVEALVLCHFSKRYSNTEILAALDNLPASLRAKTTFLPVGK